MVCVRVAGVRGLERASWGRAGSRCGCWLQCMAARPGACVDHLPPPSWPALPQAGRAIRDFFETPLGAVTFLFLFLISVRRGAPAGAVHSGGVRCASVLTSRQPRTLHSVATR